jgi:hypothetical protein
MEVVVMRNFVSATCCLIVGLEVLIGVPLAVCVGFFTVSGDFSGTYVADSTVPAPVYSPATYYPPPLPAGPAPMCVEPGKALPSCNPYTSPAPSICPALTGGPSYTEPPSAALVASLPASDPAADQLPPLPSGRAATDEPQFLARVSVSESCTDDAQQASPEAELRKSLLSTAELLYAQADRHEAKQEYDLADQLRSLARDLRDQAGNISWRNQLEPGANPTEPAATTVTVGPPPLG